MRRHDPVKPGVSAEGKHTRSLCIFARNYFMEFIINIPKINPSFVLSGVYKLTFDDGSFYIGCSSDLKGRSHSWNALMENHSNGHKKAVGSNVLAKIKEANGVIMDIVEICSSDDIQSREAFYLNLHKDNPLMLSVATCHYKPVLQYKKEDGHFIKKHVSISAAAKYNSCKIGKIQDVLNGERTAYKGMVYIYENQYQQRRKTINKRRSSFSLPPKTEEMKIQQLDIQGNIINTYSKYTEAAKNVGCHVQNIKRVLAGIQKTAAGYTWKYASQDAVPLIKY